MNNQRKRYMEQDLDGSQAQEPVTLWRQVASSSWFIDIFTNQKVSRDLEFLLKFYYVSTIG